MSVSNSISFIPVPSIPALVPDVTPFIVTSLALPEMRSLAKTSKAWNQYLNEEWRLHDWNCKSAHDLIKADKFPQLRVIEFFIRLADASSHDIAITFLKSPSIKLLSAPMEIVLTLASVHTKAPMESSVQCYLKGKGNWDALDPTIAGKIDNLVNYGTLPDEAGGVVLKRILSLFADFQDSAKSYAFTNLLFNLCARQGLHEHGGRFWRAAGNRSADFMATAKDLLPKEWNSWLATYRERSFWGLPIGRYASFVSASIICLKQLKQHAPEFGRALLQLVKSKADALPSNQKTWKAISCNLTQGDGAKELAAMQDLIFAVFCWGMPDDAAKTKGKEILCGSGFLSESTWVEFANQAPKWAKKLNLG